LFRISSTDY
jgi:hypothetical protein